MSAVVPPTPISPERLGIIKRAMARHGYVVLKESSYLRAQERQRIANVERDYEQERRQSVERWARDCCAEERRLAARLTFIYGVARARGATVEELAQ